MSCACCSHLCPNSEHQITAVQPRCPSSTLLTLLISPAEEEGNDTALSQAFSTTLKPAGGMGLQWYNADQGQASLGMVHSKALLSKSGDAQPAPGLALTLALPPHGHPIPIGLTLLFRPLSELFSFFSTPFLVLSPIWVSSPLAQIFLCCSTISLYLQRKERGGVKPRHMHTHAGYLPCSVTR